MFGKAETHPSWILVGASRVSGNRTLFQSDVDHQHYITVRVKRAKRTRDLHRDWVHGSTSADLIEFDMSAAQWAEFLTSLNVGEGVPATLTYFDGEHVEQEEAPERRIDESAKEVRQQTQKAIREVQEAIAEVEAVLDANGGKRALREALDGLKNTVGNLPSNMAFAAKSLTEHTEHLVAHAKAEVDALAVSLERRAELAAAEAWGRMQERGGMLGPIAGQPPMLDAPVDAQGEVAMSGPYEAGPGAICGDCGHLAIRHVTNNACCVGVKGSCGCPGFLWNGLRYRHPNVKGEPPMMLLDSEEER